MDRRYEEMRAAARVVDGGPTASHSIESLRLDMASAEQGKTWLLLPHGFRDRECAITYPLPTQRPDLQRISIIPLKRSAWDCGSVYIRRAMREFKRRPNTYNRAAKATDAHVERLETMHREYQSRLDNLRTESRKAVDEVKEEAKQAIASLMDLFALGRKGIAGQMQAHLDGKEWQGEKIDAGAFRQCFRMVTQAVDGLGLPTEQRASASNAIMQQVAESIQSTQDTVSVVQNTDEAEN